MTFHPDMIRNAVEAISQSENEEMGDIIIGDNSSGKSLLLKSLLIQLKEKKSIYFIDAVNRGFDVSRVISEQKRETSERSVLEKRLLDINFNIKDTFSCYGTDTERVEEIYRLYEDKVQDLFKKLTGDQFTIAASAAYGEVLLNGEAATLSSGYQAMVRMILELLFYTEKHGDHAWVVIDEIDEFLSPGYASKILSFFRENFPGIHFVVTTHSADLVVTSENARVITLKKDQYDVLDVDDLDTYRKVQRLFNGVFGVEEPVLEDTDMILRRLLNRKINDAWTDADEEILKGLHQKKLSASQRMICKQIEEW